jgi:flavin-dependent dehydrogenase
MNKKQYKVVIVGAGPSGISCGLNLIKYGIKDILIIDKSMFPRYKCCAGYITNKTKDAYEKLGLDISKCHYSLIKDFNILYKYKKRQTIDNKLLYTNKVIDRVELDYNFFKLAKKKKINILEEVKILKHDIKHNELQLSNKDIINYDYLVFADGTNGYGSRYQDSKKKNIALQLIIEDDKKEKIDIHFGITKRGYGWVSSCNGYTNVGLTDVYDNKVNYSEVFSDFLEQLNIKADIKKLTGAFTPIGIGKPIINDNIYFVGDALGACDPLTLSGLRYGLKSGEKCADAINKDNNKLYIKYANSLKYRFIFMELVQRIFYLKFSLFCIFNIGCRFFSRIVSYVFNNVFVSKK